jgi:hypothetical protein
MSSTHSTATFSRPADNVAYATGDHIANSTTGASVVPMTFPVTPTKGYITGCRAVVTPASANLVITALDFDLLLFRPATNIPFAAASFPADNAALTLTAAAYREFVGHFIFVNGAWRNPLGALTAGATGYQSVATAVRPRYHFDLTGQSTLGLIGVVQCKGAWTPTGIINQFDFTLDIEHA